jgi:hypothetical protein
METLKDIFMRRDGMTAEEADDLISEMREEVAEGAYPEDVLYDQGLEPDYIFDLLDF